MTEGRLNLAESCTLEPLKRTESQIEQLYLSFFCQRQQSTPLHQAAGWNVFTRWVFGSSQSHESKHLLC